MRGRRNAVRARSGVFCRTSRRRNVFTTQHTAFGARQSANALLAKAPAENAAVVRRCLGAAILDISDSAFGLIRRRALRSCAKVIVIADRCPGAVRLGRLCCGQSAAGRRYKWCAKERQFRPACWYAGLGTTVPYRPNQDCAMTPSPWLSAIERIHLCSVRTLVSPSSEPRCGCRSAHRHATPPPPPATGCLFRRLRRALRLRRFPRHQSPGVLDLGPFHQLPAKQQRQDQCHENSKRSRHFDPRIAAIE